MFFLLTLLAFLSEQALVASNPTPFPTLEPKNGQGIVPKSKTKGVDLCGIKDTYFIIRSDLGCYMKATDLNQGSGLEIFNLHLTCRGGEHYLAHKDSHFYIIKENTYRRVANLSTDAGAKVYDLHPNCRNGDHYFAHGSYFYIVFKKKGTYRRVSDLSTDDSGTEEKIHPDLIDGLYYWGTQNNIYYMKPNPIWGVEYSRTTDLKSNQSPKTFSFHHDVISFLPGGFALTYGPCAGVWEAIRIIDNANEYTNITFEEKVVRKVGYDKQKISTLQHNWRITAGIGLDLPSLLKSILQLQLSLEMEYGGSSVNTEQESWTEATEVTENICFTVLPRSTVGLWKYKLSLGKHDVLFCRDIALTDDRKPPNFIPFSSTNSAKDDNKLGLK